MWHVLRAVWIWSPNHVTKFGRQQPGHRKHHLLDAWSHRRQWPTLVMNRSTEIFDKFFKRVRRRCVMISPRDTYKATSAPLHCFLMCWDVRKTNNIGIQRSQHKSRPLSARLWPLFALLDSARNRSQIEVPQRITGTIFAIGKPSFNPFWLNVRKYTHTDGHYWYTVAPIRERQK